jgi:hypothetical protein
VSMRITSPSDDDAPAGLRPVIISSDGHAVARMDDYREYIPAEFREEFDAFRKVLGAGKCSQHRGR